MTTMIKGLVCLTDGGLTGLISGDEILLLCIDHKPIQVEFLYELWGKEKTRERIEDLLDQAWEGKGTPITAWLDEAGEFQYQIG